MIAHTHTCKHTHTHSQGKRFWHRGVRTPAGRIATVHSQGLTAYSAAYAVCQACAPAASAQPHKRPPSVCSPTDPCCTQRTQPTHPYAHTPICTRHTHTQNTHTHAHAHTHTHKAHTHTKHTHADAAPPPPAPAPAVGLAPIHLKPRKAHPCWSCRCCCCCLEYGARGGGLCAASMAAGHGRQGTQPPRAATAAPKRCATLRMVAAAGRRRWREQQQHVPARILAAPALSSRGAATAVPPAPMQPTAQATPGGAAAATGAIRHYLTNTVTAAHPSLHLWSRKGRGGARGGRGHSIWVGQSCLSWAGAFSTIRPVGTISTIGIIGRVGATRCTGAACPAAHSCLTTLPKNRRGGSGGRTANLT